MMLVASQRLQRAMVTVHVAGLDECADEIVA
jgi:hypothetical protein